MNFIRLGITYFLISLAVKGFLSLQPREGETGKVYLHKKYLIVGLAGFIFFLFLTLLAAFQPDATASVLFFSAFSFLGLLQILFFVNYRITYDEERFTAGTLFGFKKRIAYDQITAVRKTAHVRGNEYKIYAGKSKVTVDCASMVGGKEFIAHLKEKNPAAFQRGLSKSDIFNGNIEGAPGVIIVLAAFAVVALSLKAPVTIRTKDVDATVAGVVRTEVDHKGRKNGIIPPDILIGPVGFL